jgi:hypothetical protein
VAVKQAIGVPHDEGRKAPFRSTGTFPGRCTNTERAPIAARDEGLKPHIVNKQAMIMLNTGSDTGRNGFWIELPSFVFTTQATYQITNTSRSVAVVRWQEFTGESATLEG